MKHALITGITGQDGSYLAELLLEKGYDVYGLVRRLSHPNYMRIEHILDRITLIRGDLLDQSSLMQALEISQPDEVYNLAAQSHVGLSFQMPVATAEYSGLGVMRLIEAIRQVNPAIRFYQASTSELYGQVKESPQDEHTPFHPRSPYGVAKLYGHYATINYREAYDMHASCGILFNHESPRRGADFVTRKICRAVAGISQGNASKVVLGNLDARRDWGYAPDYVEAMWLMLQQEKPDDFVIATGETHSVREFARYAFGHIGIQAWEHYVQVDPTLYRPAEVHLLQGDATKAKTILGWKPTHTFENLITIMMEAELGELRVPCPSP